MPESCRQSGVLPGRNVQSSSLLGEKRAGLAADLVDSRQVRYVRLLDGNRWYVVSEIDSHGTETYYASEGDGGDYFRFTPTPAERKQVRRLRAEGAGRQGWSACVDLDASVEDLSSATIAEFEAFRNCVCRHAAGLAEFHPGRSGWNEQRLAIEVNAHLDKGWSLVRAVARWLRNNELLRQAADACQGRPPGS